MDTPYDCMLTIAFPVALEEELLDCLLAQTQWVRGFSVLHAEGFGAGARLGSALENVRGRAHRRLVTILMARPNVAPVLEALRQQFSSPEIAWWTSPVDGFGRLA